MTTTSSITLPLVGAGSEDVSYEVTWQTDVVGGCSGVSHANRTSITDGSSEVDIIGLEEDSCYSITMEKLTMSNSTKVNIALLTSEAGENLSLG